MQDQINQVRDFHERMQISKTQQLPAIHLPVEGVVGDVISRVARMSKQLEELGAFDERYNRLHLILEETAELAAALATGCDPNDDESRLNYETAVLDALADLTYVVFGSAVAFDLPLANGFSEVHASNMTKEKQPTDPSAHRVRAKGPNYRPPNLKDIVRLHRFKG
jgi:predicted HAD superfamily Cof-like phosphohydrolase